MTSQSLAETLQAHAIDLAAPQIARIENYCHLLWDWNRQLNLTRHTDFDTFVTRDVLDSVQLAGCLGANESILDIGTGGGVPGILIAILRPDVQVTLSESVAKRASALSDMVSRLDLPCAIIHGRAEHALVDLEFDTLVARAVGSLAKVLKWLGPHWSSIGRLLLIKGPRWVDERKEARHLGLLRELELRRLQSYCMPNTDSESVILAVYPRTEDVQTASRVSNSS